MLSCRAGSRPRTRRDPVRAGDARLEPGEDLGLDGVVNRHDGTLHVNVHRVDVRLRLVDVVDLEGEVFSIVDRERLLGGREVLIADRRAPACRKPS